jgi:hypothetical protein
MVLPYLTRYICTVPAKTVGKPNIVVIRSSPLEYIDHQRVVILANHSFNQSIIEIERVSETERG